MSDTHQNQAGTSPDLSREESLILDVLTEEAGPLDVITISNRTRLPIEDVLRWVEKLRERGMVTRADPEPVHERFTPAAPTSKPLQHA